MEAEEITHKIIGCAFNVFNTLGFGFLESVYHKALLIELANNGLHFQSERALKVFYDNQVVGDFKVDIFVEDEVVVELKSVQAIAKAHEVQLVNYLNGTKKEVGLLIIFAPNGVEVRRKYRRP